MARKKPTRRDVYLGLVSQIEGQLRDAYALRYDAGETTQADLARLLETDRSAIHRRLTGQASMRLQTVADMVWALRHEIHVEIKPCQMAVDE